MRGLSSLTSSSIVSALSTRAERRGDAYVLTGEKRFISNAGVATHYTVFARTGTRDDGRPTLSAFVVSARMQRL